MTITYKHVIQYRKSISNLYSDLRTYRTHIEFNNLDGCLISILLFLRDYQINIRNKGDILFQVTLSESENIKNTIFVGLRYLKFDNSESEDLYEVRGDRAPVLINSTSKCPHIEYKNTHKLSIIKNLDYKIHLRNYFLDRKDIYEHQIFDNSHNGYVNKLK